MSSAIDIHIVNTPNLEKIENFLKDSMYRESIEFSANFNTRLCIERRLRLPFLDPQTGVAQNHSNLFMDKRQRMPGFRQGQIYTYPAARWRKSRRQYLSKMYRFPDRPFQSVRKDAEGNSSGIAAGTIGGPYGLISNNLNSTTTIISAATVNVPLAVGAADNDFNGTLLEESSSLGGAGDTSDSKDSQQHLKEDLPKEWFYDEMDINEMDSLEEPKSPADDEYDYDPRYGNKKRRKRRPGKKALGTSTESGSRKRQSSGGRGSGGSGGGGGGAIDNLVGGGGGGVGEYDYDGPSTSLSEKYTMHHQTSGVGGGGGGVDRERVDLKDFSARSDISTDSIDRTGGSGPGMNNSSSSGMHYHQQPHYLKHMKHGNKHQSNNSVAMQNAEVIQSLTDRIQNLHTRDGGIGGGMGAPYGGGGGREGNHGNITVQSEIISGRIGAGGGGGAGGGANGNDEQMIEAWLDELQAAGAKIVLVTYPRTANNDKEMSVVRGEYLEVLDDSRKWWKVRNSRGQIAHVPHTIVTPYNYNENEFNNQY